MKRKIRSLVLLACCLLLWGCEKQTEEVMATVETEPIVLATVPEDGNPEDVTCKGTYTVFPDEVDGNAVVAAVGKEKLTNGALIAWYHGAIAQYRQDNHPEALDFEADLNTQICQADGSVNSWEQYFLREALDNWHTAQVLKTASETDKLEKDPAYDPNPEELKQYMTDMPVTEVLYGYHDYYRPNSMHRAFLDGIPEMLETMAREKGFADADAMAKESFGAEAVVLEEMVQLYNYGYMYFTHLSYGLETEEIPETDAATQGQRYVDIRQVLLVPDAVADRKGNVTDPVMVAADGTVTCSEERWTKCQAQAEKLLRQWKKARGEPEANFRKMAFENSEDAASLNNGGIYNRIQKGQLARELDDWCFDARRKAGDVTTIRTKYGIHILYFAGSRAVDTVKKQQDADIQAEKNLIAELKDRFPVKIDYEKIQLSRASATVSYSDFLYPDVAHERYPEIPLYLQQAYGSLKYGDDLLYTHGCGITSFSMLSTYMTETEYFPEEMCRRYRRYNADGTDGMIFINEPATMGFYLVERTYNPDTALEALKNGHPVISLQSRGYWTNGGHYITLEKITEDGMIQVRDTHMLNYGRIENHKQDKHEVRSVTAFGAGGYWIMSQKVKTIPFCSRCGDGTGVGGFVNTADYLCEKCESAVMRRTVWLGA